jgi:predicted transcriptional regulator
MSVTKQQLDSFHRFASRRIQSQPAASLDELLEQWRHEAEQNETAADIQQGLRDYAAGEARPVDEAFADVRRRAGLSE